MRTEGVRNMKKIKKGLVQIYTGEGKGKTTAAVGLACRARGHNFKVCYIYFHKSAGNRNYGEHKILKKMGVDVFGFARQCPRFRKNAIPAEIRGECLEGVKFIKKIYEENNYDILILDEINISCREGFLKAPEILDIIKSRPGNMELILTGRGASKKILENADLVSEIKNVKHPYKKGIKSRKGIEY